MNAFRSAEENVAAFGRAAARRGVAFECRSDRCFRAVPQDQRAVLGRDDHLRALRDQLQQLVREHFNIDMSFVYAAGSILEGERLGMAISVEKNGTNPGDGLEFMYDHPSFDSRLTVDANQVLPF